MSKQRICGIAVSTIPARSPFVAIALVVLLASSFAAASTPQGHFEKTFQVSGAVDLEVQTRSGDIIVRNGPAGSGSIRGQIYVGEHWLFGWPHTDVSGIEQHPPPRQGRNKSRVRVVDSRENSAVCDIT